MELKEEDGWLSVHVQGLSTIVINAGLELIKAVAKKHGIPLPKGRIGEQTFLNMLGLFTDHEMIKQDHAAGYPTVLSREKIQALRTEPQPVLALSYKTDEESISIENNVPLGPFGLEKPYEPLIVELVEAAAGLRDKFPL